MEPRGWPFGATPASKGSGVEMRGVTSVTPRFASERIRAFLDQVSLTEIAGSFPNLSSTEDPGATSIGGTIEPQITN